MINTDMEKNLDLIADELFNKIKTQFPTLEIGDEESQKTDEPSKARFFDFDYQHKGNSLGRITISLSDDEGLVVIFSNNITKDQNEYVKKQFFNFLKELREFAKQKVLKFSMRDITKSNLEKRDYEFLSKKNFGESKMNESKLFGTAKTSYQRIGESTLIIKHRDYVNQENPAGRAQRIESIYIESAQGERFLYPHKHLNGARALAQHVNHGGNPYDNIGQYVIGLSEELGRLRMFKGYVDRNEAISESMGNIHTKVVERIDHIKKEINQLQKNNYYETFSENYTPQENIEIPEDIANEWIDRLTIRTFNEELKNVFPYIFKLIDESDVPVKDLNPNDIIDDTITENEIAYEKDIPEFAAFEKHLNRITEADSDLFSENNEDLINQLNELLTQELPVGVNGTNAIESLSGIIDDEELTQVFKEIADINPDTDARELIKSYIEEKDEQKGTDVLSQLNFDGVAEPAAAADTTEVPEPAAQPAMDPNAAMQAPAAPDASGMGIPAEPQPQMASISHSGNRLAEVIGKAIRAGMKLEDTFEVAGKQITLQDAISRAGMQVEDFFDGEKNTQSELIEFVKSMYNAEEGSFPKGETGVLLACEKKFGESAVPMAKQVIGKLHSLNEMERMKKLSGISNSGEEESDDNVLQQVRRNKEWRNHARDARKQGRDYSPTGLPGYIDRMKKLSGIK